MARSDLPILADGFDYLTVTVAVPVDGPLTADEREGVRKLFADAAVRAHDARIEGAQR